MACYDAICVEWVETCYSSHGLATTRRRGYSRRGFSSRVKGKYPTVVVAMQAGPRKPAGKVTYQSQVGPSGKLFEGQSFCLLGFKPLDREWGNSSQWALQAAKSKSGRSANGSSFLAVNNDVDCTAVQSISRTLEDLITQVGCEGRYAKCW